MMEMFILEDKKPKQVYDIGIWSSWMHQFEERRIALTYINSVKVSTVFLGMNHNYSGKGPPILFETMILDGEKDGYQQRYCTYEEAEIGHKKAVELAGEQK